MNLPSIKPGPDTLHSALDLTGRICVVTGGARGIGRAIVTTLRELGGQVVIADVLDAEGGALAASDDGIDFRHLDVTDPSAIETAMAQVAADYGRLDVLVTSAGIANHDDAQAISYADWQRVLQVNATGTFWCAREAARQMRPGSAIVAVGSMSGEIANAPQPQAAYNASKGAVHLAVRSLAVELVDAGIRVNAVAPGYVETELTADGVPEAWVHDWLRRTPMARMGRPHEIAHLVAFLASDAASYLTGTIVPIDGGYTAW